mmetsp:Transcript_90543/g.283148  ORF Transcript_90543/g.283148 Transcript_90543/m.283148 type:complete len:251 (-) Transcript_90543:71-823(-)
MVLGDQRPVGHHPADPHARLLLPHEEVLDRHGVEKLGVLREQGRAQHRGHEQSGVLHHHVVALVVVRHSEFIQQLVCWFAHHHGAEQLPTEPATAAWRHVLLHDRHLYAWVLSELVGAGEAGGARSDDHHVGLGVVHHVGHVPRCHLAAYDRLLDGFEGHGVEVRELLSGIGQALRGQPLLRQRQRRARAQRRQHPRREVLRATGCENARLAEGRAREHPRGVLGSSTVLLEVRSKGEDGRGRFPAQVLP